MEMKYPHRKMSTLLISLLMFPSDLLLFFVGCQCLWKCTYVRLCWCYWFSSKVLVCLRKLLDVAWLQIFNAPWMVYVYVHCTIYPGIVRCLLLARIFEAWKNIMAIISITPNSTCKYSFLILISFAFSIQTERHRHHHRYQFKCGSEFVTPWL